MMACAQGALAGLAMKEGSGDITWSSGASFFPFFRESIKKVGRIHYPDVIVGSRDEVSERARKSPYFYGGWVVLALTPGDAAVVLPWVLGADASGSTYALAETLQTMGVLVDKVTGVHEFYNGVINRAVISGTQNGPGGRPNWITVALQMFFRNYNPPGTADSFPTASYSVTGAFAPLVFEDAVLTLDGSSREVKKFTIDLNNHIQPRWVNNLEATALCPSKRTVGASFVLPYDSGNSSLYDAALAGVGGTLAITNSTVSVTAQLTAYQIDTETPEVRGKQEIDLILNGFTRKSGSTASIIFQVDSTP